MRRYKQDKYTKDEIVKVEKQFLKIKSIRG